MVDEGMAVRNGERLNIQCLMMGYKKDNDDEKVKYHYHKYMEFLFYIDGEQEVHVGDKCIKCKSNELFIIYANEPHGFYNLSDNKYFVIKFLPDILRTSEQSIKEFEYIFNFNMGIHSRIIKDEDGELKRLFADAYEKFVDGKYSNELFVRSDILRICGEIIKRWDKNGETVSISSIAGHDNLVAIQNVIEKTKESCGAFKTHEAAKMCNLSDGHFSRLFKSIMNMSFMQYVKNVKIDEAERLLKCTDLTVTEIAQILNYASTSHFIEDFRKEKGISPKQYKKGM